MSCQSISFEGGTILGLVSELVSGKIHKETLAVSGEVVILVCGRSTLSSTPSRRTLPRRFPLGPSLLHPAPLISEPSGSPETRFLATVSDSEGEELSATLKLSFFEPSRSAISVLTCVIKRSILSSR